GPQRLAELRAHPVPDAVGGELVDPGHDLPADGQRVVPGLRGGLRRGGRGEEDCRDGGEECWVAHGSPVVLDGASCASARRARRRVGQFPAESDLAGCCCCCCCRYWLFDRTLAPLRAPSGPTASRQTAGSSGRASNITSRV